MANFVIIGVTDQSATLVFGFAHIREWHDVNFPVLLLCKKTDLVIFVNMVSIDIFGENWQFVTVFPAEMAIFYILLNMRSLTVDAGEEFFGFEIDFIANPSFKTFRSWTWVSDKFIFHKALSKFKFNVSKTDHWDNSMNPFGDNLKANKGKASN